MTDQDPTQHEPQQDREQSPWRQQQQQAAQQPQRETEQSPQRQQQQKTQQPQRQPQQPQQEAQQPQQEAQQPQPQQQPPAQTPRDREIIVTDRGSGGSGPGMVIGVILAIVALVVVGVLAFGYIQNGGSDSMVPGEVNVNVEMPSSE